MGQGDEAVTTHACINRTGRLAGCLAVMLTCAAAAALPSCSRSPRYRTFDTPEAAVQALTGAVKQGKLDEMIAIFGPESQELIDSSDVATARRNQQVFTAAVAERWRLQELGPDRRELVIGNEDWPFPVPLVKERGGWRFDTAAGKEEVLARRIGRNELAVLRICRTYVDAQQQYARAGHDGQPAGIYAQRFRSDAGRQNGLYWPPRGRNLSPLGDLVAEAAAEGYKAGEKEDRPAPFHGYYFRILTGQGDAAPGGAKDYLVNGAMSRGFALVAWPAQYDATGVMTFIVNQDGIIREKDLGSDTDAAARKMTVYNPDASWGTVE